MASATELRLRGSIDDGEWAALLAADSRARVFHEPWVVRAFASTLPRSRALWLELRVGGTLVAGLPLVERSRGPWRAWISVPGGGYGGPVVCRDDPQHGMHEHELLHAFATQRPRSILRRELVFGHQEPEHFERMHCVDSAYLEIGGDFEAFLRTRFPKNRRNECNRSERRGLAVLRTRDEQVLRAFHPIYAERSRMWGSEVLPLELMLALLGGSERFQFFAAQQDGNVVGGHLCAEANDELFAWVGTTQRMENTFPSSLLIREEARYASERGFERLDLGSSLGVSGVRNYKRLLGAQSRPLWLHGGEAAPLRWIARLRGGGGS